MCQIASEIIKLVIFSPSINFQSYETDLNLEFGQGSLHIYIYYPLCFRHCNWWHFDHVSIEYNVSKGTGEQGYY